MVTIHLGVAFQTFQISAFDLTTNIFFSKRLLVVRTLDEVPLVAKPFEGPTSDIGLPASMFRFHQGTRVFSPSFRGHMPLKNLGLDVHLPKLLQTRFEQMTCPQLLDQQELSNSMYGGFPSHVEL